MNNQKWTVDLSDTDSEIWYEEVECDTREEAILIGSKLALENDCKVFRIGLKKDDVKPYINIDYIIDTIKEEMYDEYGEVAADYLSHDLNDDNIDMIEDELNEVFNKWLKRTNNEAGFYRVENPEFVEVEEIKNDTDCEKEEIFPILLTGKVIKNEN